jgi:hypothetical protein
VIFPGQNGRGNPEPGTKQAQSIASLRDIGKDSTDDRMRKRAAVNGRLGLHKSRQNQAQ